MNNVQKVMTLSLLAGLLLAGCGNDEPTIPETANIDTSSMTLVKGTQTTCPIMGNPINEDVYVDYQDKRIYFCCAGCDTSFQEDPDKYIKQMEDEGVVLTKIEK